MDKVHMGGNCGADRDSDDMSSRFPLGYAVRYVATAFVVIATLSLAVAPAEALQTHSLATTFGAGVSIPANPYPLSNPAGVAVDNSTGASAHDIYVTDPANHRVEKFNEKGEFLLMFGQHVDQTTGGNVCPEHAGDVCQAGSASSLPGGFSEPAFVAVDSSPGGEGDIYVGDIGDESVSKFDPSGNLIATWGAGGQISGFFRLAGITVDQGGNLFVVVETKVYWYTQSGKPHSTFNLERGTPESSGLAAIDAEDNIYSGEFSGDITKLTDTGTTIGQPDVGHGEASGLAIDPSTNDLYVVQTGEGGFVNHFALNCGRGCSPLDAFGSGNLSNPHGISIDGSSDDVYVANTGEGDVVVFSPIIVPGVVVEPPSDLTSTSVALNGHAEPAGAGEITECLVEYGISTTYGQTAPCSPAPPYAGPADISAALSGLGIDLTYHYRFVISTTTEGVSQGIDHTFKTRGSPIFSYGAEPSTTQAGGHPDITTVFSYVSRLVPRGETSECGCREPKDITNRLPTGVIGNPHATPQCTRVAFGENDCSPSTQVGWATATIEINSLSAPVYNVEPNPDQAGVLGFTPPLASSPVFIILSARTGSDYGLNATLAGLQHLLPINKVALTLWGVPADSSHDADRAPLGSRGCLERYPCFPSNPSNGERTPFLDNPTTCGEPLSSAVEILDYDGGVSSASSPWPATTGCDQLTFNPSLYAQPTTKQADSASGLDVDLSVPQLASPSAPSPSEIRALSVKLPAGMSINPNAADGKTACSDSEARFGSEEESECSEFSKVGTVSLNSSALPGPIPGSIYIGEPEPGDRYRLILTANGFATHVKLAGSVEPDPQTGRLLVSFKNLPQSPFSEFDLHFFGSERGLLATPTQCGTYPVESTFAPWDSALSTQVSTQYFNIEEGPDGEGCPTPPRSFSPGFTASDAESTAGFHSPFSLELTRPDGDQNLSALTVSTPPGFSATLKGIPYCSDAALAAAANTSYSGLAEESNPSCPAASQIGTSQAGSGAGTHPVYLPGKVYLAGPYKGAPLSLAVITPAVSGPYDLGDVVVRAALRVNPQTAQITTVSDPLPQILQGVPLRLRSIRINLDRPNFVLNPTNCAPFSVGMEAFGDEGTVASSTEHFQVANCASLPYKPKLSLELSGGLNRLGHPAIHSVLTTKPGEANTAMVSVALPKGEILDNAHINSPCTRVELDAETCPPGSVLGHAVAVTPLLDQPLEGPVYLTTGFGHQLPDLIADLKGQIHIQLDGRVDTVDGGSLRTTFQTVPDAPVSTFTLDLAGGSKGLIENEKALCGAHKAAAVRMAGQNGKVLNRNVHLRASCAKKSAKKHRKAPGSHKNRGAHR